MVAALEDSHMDVLNTLNVESLDVSYNAISSDGFYTLIKNKHIKSLDMGLNEITERDNYKIINNKLESLDLSSNPLQEATLEGLINFRKLKHLHLGYIPLSKQQLVNLTKLKNLEYLSLEHCYLSKELIIYFLKRFKPKRKITINLKKNYYIDIDFVNELKKHPYIKIII